MGPLTSAQAETQLNPIPSPLSLGAIPRPHSSSPPPLFVSPLQTRLRDWAAASFAVAGTTLLSFLLLSVLSGLSPRSLTQLMISTSALHVRPAFALQPRGLGPRRTRAGAHMQLPGVGLSGAVEDAVQELEDRTRPLHEDTRDHDPAADLMSNVEDGAEAVPPPSGGDVKVL